MNASRQFDDSSGRERDKLCLFIFIFIPCPILTVCLLSCHFHSLLLPADTRGVFCVSRHVSVLAQPRYLRKYSSICAVIFPLDSDMTCNVAADSELNVVTFKRFLISFVIDILIYYCYDKKFSLRFVLSKKIKQEK